MAAIETAKAIQTLLQDYGVENDSLNAFVKEAEELPSGKTLDEYNSLVEDYQNASSYENIVSSAEAILEFYNAHKEELSHKASEMAKLDATMDDFRKLNDLYEQLDSELENGEL